MYPSSLFTWILEVFKRYLHVSVIPQKLIKIWSWSALWQNSDVMLLAYLGHQTFPRMFARKPIPASMRSDQISPASSSSSSSGLMADIEVPAAHWRRPRRESELELALQKLKDVSTDGQTGNSCPLLLHHWIVLWLQQREGRVVPG